MEVVRRVKELDADVAMIAHVGSTQAHPCCVRTLAALKATLPELITVYGGVYPTYHDGYGCERGSSALSPSAVAAALRA